MDLRGDFLIIGSGVAGLRAAISLAEVGDVVVLTKADPAESNTGYAQGGIAAAIGPGDSPALHARDTIEAGDGLSNEAAVEILVGDGVRYVEELCDWGVAFDRDPTGQLALAREGAHSVRRVLHARDATGREIGRVLWSRVSANPRVRVIDDAEATDISMQGGVCVGVTFADGSGTERRVEAPATLLATGGAGQVFRETTNPGVATGDGVAMAFRAGARITDLEFIQFHPTVLSVEGAQRFLLSEALRGEGARLVNVRDEAFVGQYHPAGDLAPRDRVARAMVWEAHRTGAPVYLSVQRLASEFVHGRFPTIARVCRVAGLDLATDRIPVSPAAHYVMGGVETDLHGRTSLPGLFAAGEVACTGARGANRLASNSLLEGLVFGARAAQTMTSGGATALAAADSFADAVVRAPASTVPTAFEVRDLMWKQAGLSRDRAGLEGAVRTLDGWLRGCDQRSTDRAHRRTVNLLTVGLLVATAALRREESRGAHFRTDFPERDDVHWKTHAAETRRVT